MDLDVCSYKYFIFGNTYINQIHSTHHCHTQQYNSVLDKRHGWLLYLGQS